MIPNRKIAGELLAEKLKPYQNAADVIVLGLPRGGIPVAYEISQKLHAPLDAFLVRKLGVPWHEELAMGAIAMDRQVLNKEVIASLNISESEIQQVAATEKKELERRNQLYRQGKPVPDLRNKIVILVDDGLATGATMRVAVIAIKKLAPKKIIIAIPVSAADTYNEFKNSVDDIVALLTPENFMAISQWYEYFPQTSDEEVIALLNAAEKNLQNGNRK